jgi:hypothetical protein
MTALQFLSFTCRRTTKGIDCHVSIKLIKSPIKSTDPNSGEDKICPFLHSVILAKAGIHIFEALGKLDSRLARMTVVRAIIFRGNKSSIP